MRRIVLSMLLIGLSQALGCSSSGDQEDQPAFTLARPEAVGDPLAPYRRGDVPLPLRPLPPPRVYAPEQDAPALSRSPGTDPARLRLDASSPERLLASLQLAERELGPRDLADLRAAMTAFMIASGRRAAEIAMRTGQAQFSDDELLAMAYAEVHGKDLREVIDTGLRIGSALEAASREQSPRMSPSMLPQPPGFPAQ